MAAKLNSGAYTDRKKFEADFYLMIANAKDYNTNGSFAFNEAVALNTFFEKRRYCFIVYSLSQSSLCNRMVQDLEDSGEG
jgi:hypothetical protein